MAKKFVLLDLNCTEVFDTEDEVRERAEEWRQQEIEQAMHCIRDSDIDELKRWDEEYRQSGYDDLVYQIRIYEVDTDVFEHEVNTKCGKEVICAEGCDEGVERIETIDTGAESLLGMNLVDKYHELYGDNNEENEEEE